MKPTAEAIITNLLYAMDGIRDRSDDELKEAFLDFDADPVVRDTAQVVLEARGYLRREEEVKFTGFRTYECSGSRGMNLHEYGQWVPLCDANNLLSGVRKLVGECQPFLDSAGHSGRTNACRAMRAFLAQHPEGREG